MGENLKKYWEDNVRKHVKLISGILGDVLIKIFTILLYSLKADLDTAVFLYVLLFGISPYIILFINIVFKGETQQKDLEIQKLQIDNAWKDKIISLQRSNDELVTRLQYKNEIAEYRCLLAAKEGKVPDAVIANKDWNDTNDKLESLSNE